MLGKIALILALVVSVVSIPVLSSSAAPPTMSKPALVRNVRMIDQYLDRALRNMRAAERLVDEKHLSNADAAVDQALRLVRSAEIKVDRALGVVRSAEASKLSTEQVEQVERLSREARRELRRADSMVARLTYRSMEFKRLRSMLKDADRQVDQALSLLRQIIAGL